ncbi:MAG: RimK family alpha-L-glutamate ligase [Oscillospiraceae bacterium]|nr:RimK family alpha-L-glutamate ligase [Oscillospiraceae bacterium]
MAGYVFYNGFWNPDGPPEVVRSLTAAAAARGALWTPLPNTAVTAEFTGERRERALRVPPLQAGDYALFWDKDVRLARALEAMGVRLYNTAAAVAVCDDKAATHLELARRGVPMPRTLVAPMTYVNMDAQGDAFLRRGAETLGFPLVVKECFGSLGGQVYLARDRGQLCRLADTMGPKPFLLQQFVAASAGEDKRLYVVGGRVAAAMRRRSETDFRANIGGGGRGEACSPTAEEERLALECAAILGAEIAGVDLLQSETGPLVCEVNSNAHFAALTACTGVDVAGLIADYVLQREE